MAPEDQYLTPDGDIPYPLDEQIGGLSVVTDVKRQMDRMLLECPRPMTLEDRKKIILQSYIHYMIGDTDIERITNTHRMTDDAFVMALCDRVFTSFTRKHRDRSSSFGQAWIRVSFVRSKTMNSNKI